MTFTLAETMLPAVFEKLEPAPVWAHFATLCAIPRPSKGEAALRDHLAGWAKDRGLAVLVDSAGNLLVRKPASPGREASPGVVLQSHLDMVCQANADTPHDFTRDPIRPRRDDGWLVGEGTTLGADNGIGVALMLAALEDTDLEHGPLEALFTVDEESGMGGARGLAPGWLNGRRLLNLDTEHWGHIYVGCAGGVDVNVRRAATAEAAPAAGLGLRIALGGLRGGHSGVNIHEGRGNAIKLLVRVLRALERRWPLRLATLVGGTARNALPREATATLVVPPAAQADLAAWLGEVQGALRAEYAGIDDGVTLSAAPYAVERVMAAAEQAAWLASLHAAPFGVDRMSTPLPGVVETSNNLGVVDLGPDGGHANFMIRSLVDAGADELAARLESLFALSATSVERAGDYPGWKPEPASPLLALCRSVYRETFGEEPETQVIHAGLECGIIGGTYPGLDMVSFGPTIEGAHAPGERVEIASVGRCWILLREMLAAIR